MRNFVDRPNRLVIPRWREFNETSRKGELQIDKNKNSPIIPVTSIKEQIENWNKQNSIVNAIELVNSAFVINKKSVAKQAALFIIDNCEDKAHPLIKISKKILEEEINEKNVIEETAKNSFEHLNSIISCKIHRIRKRIKLNPLNTILWLDYARWYTVIGKFNEAEKCINTAVQLNPNNVFVIRCAVRFFLHKHKYDAEGKDSLSYALQLIRKNPATKIDPWLMATEISLCAYLEKTSNLIKLGLSTIEARNFSPFSLSELTAAIATEELKNGSNKSSRKLFISSLIDPNENTIAQAEWATKHIGSLPLNLKIANSFEASSYYNLFEENWDEAVLDALKWIVDQPFSRAPVNHASYLASAIKDNNQLSIDICDFGLRANPQEFTLLNNKAYSLAIEKKSSEAEKVFNQISISNLTEREKVVHTATKGLISYSKGNNEEGNRLYNEAEAQAKKNKDERGAFKLKVYKTNTELIFGDINKDNIEVIEGLIKEYQNYKFPDIKKLIDNISRRFGVNL